MSDIVERLQEALETLDGVRVFVTSRERIKHPEGTEWFDDRVASLRAEVARLRAEREGRKE